MKLTPSSEAPCKLSRCEIRRVPQNLASGIVGYHLCCPRCGFVSIAINGSKGLEITEERGDDEIRASFSQPLRCHYCQVLIHVSRGEARLEEDEHVRPINYR